MMCISLPEVETGSGARRTSADPPLEVSIVSLPLVLLPLQDRGSAGALRRVFRPAYCISAVVVLMPRGFCGVSASLEDGAADVGLALLFWRAEEGRSLASAGCLVGDSGCLETRVCDGRRNRSPFLPMRRRGSSQRHVDGIWRVVKAGVPTMVRWDLHSVELAHGAER